MINKDNCRVEFLKLKIMIQARFISDDEVKFVIIACLETRPLY